MPPEDPIKLWQHFHGATVHFALSLSLVSVGFDLAGALFAKKEWRTVGFWALVVGALLAIPSILSGLWGQLGWFHVTPWEADHLLLHRNLALGGGIALNGLLAWRVATRDFGSGARDTRRGRAYPVYLTLALAAALAIGYASYLGGYVARGY